MKRIFTLTVMTTIMITVFAQVPQKMSYQAVIRNSSGGLVTNQPVGVKISILQGSPSGTVVYAETYNPVPRTNANGLVTVEIGSGTPSTGTFAEIKWASESYYLKTETDPSGGINYTIVGTSQLLSVPYALHAKTVQTGDNWGTQSVAVNSGYFTGNGTSASPLTLSSMGASSGQVLKYNGTIWDNATDDNGPWSDTSDGISYSGTKKVGIGINKPTQQLTVADGSTACYVNIQNTSTGFNALDGLLMGIEGTNAYVTTNEIGKLYLGTNSVIRLSIASDGDVGIGTTAPIYKLDVAGTANLNKGIASGPALSCNGAEAIWFDGTYFSWGYGGTWNYFKDAVGIDCQPGQGHLLAVNGVASKPGGGSWSTFSDIRLKDIHGNYQRGLEDIIQLRPVRFNYKPGNAMNLPSTTEYVGFIAQEVQKVFPETITETPGGYLEFDIHAVNVAFVNAIKELNAKVYDLQVENNRVKAENKGLKTEIQKLNSRLDKIESLVGARAEK